MSLASEIVGRIETIGTVPTAVAQVFGLVNDPKTTMADFERVVRPDVGLTANLLRCANSAYYRASREITSVRDAIARMGMRRVFEVAAGASFAKAVPAVLTGYGTPSASYWEHSIAVAVLADRIGREAGFTYPDLAFTAGLLHDLGKIVVSGWLDANPALQVPVGGLTTVESSSTSCWARPTPSSARRCARSGISPGTSAGRRAGITRRATRRRRRCATWPPSSRWQTRRPTRPASAKGSSRSSSRSRRWSG